MAKDPLTAVIVGAGHRAMVYASLAQQQPEELKIVGVADPMAYRREQVAKLYDIPAERCFESADALAAVPRFADAVINGTMDRHHVPTSIPLLKAGYHEAEMWDLVRTAREYDRKVMICHVLRYAPFYTDIRRRVAAGEIGEVISVQTVYTASGRRRRTSMAPCSWPSAAMTWT